MKLRLRVEPPLAASRCFMLGTLLVAATTALFATTGWTAGAGRSLPNIVFILADDVGWADLGRYHERYAGGTAPVPTPNLNRLCDGGMMFTDAQLPASLCAPTRFSLITGSSIQRSREFGTWNATQSSAFHFGPAENDRISNPHRTIGRVLQGAGYRTAYFGKMHFGGDFYDTNGNVLRNIGSAQLNQIDFSRRFGNGLLDHGFNYTFVNPDGIQGPLYLWFENDLHRPISSFAAEVNGVGPGPVSVLRAFTAGETVGDGQIIADGFGDSRFDTSDHGPILSHFATKFMRDHVTAHPGQPFMVYYATPAIHLPLTPSVDGLEAAGRTGLGPRADFLFDLDLQIGRLLATLDELGIADNTMVVFTSDNGGAISGGEGQIGAGQPPNGPFRGNKGSIYEGGHRVPFVWKWGNGTTNGSVIPPRTVCNHLVSVLDWVPSIIDLLGGSVASDQHQDSVSLLPLLFSPNPDARPAVRTRHYYYENNSERRCARLDDAAGKWFFVRSSATAPMELYDLATDLSQATNLVAGFPTIADLPTNHVHRARIQDMEAWYLAHNNANDPRTTPALNYGVSTQVPSAISVNLTDFATDVQQIDADEVFGIAAENSVLGGWVNLNRTTSASDLAYDTGSASTVDVTLTAPNQWATFNAAYDDTPLKGGIEDYTNTASPTRITFTDLNASFPQGCRAIVYVGGFNNNAGASITDGATTYYYQTLNSPTAPVTFTQTTVTNDLGNGNAPFAQYAVFGSLASPLTSNTITFTIDTLYGGGSAITAVQLLGQGVPAASPKTPIPVPVPPPAASIHLLATPSEAEISFVDLFADVAYAVEENTGGLTGTWQPFATISNLTLWTTNVSLSSNARFFRSASTNHVRRLSLPLVP